VIYLLDTNAFSDLVRDHPLVNARLAAASSDRVLTCSVVRGEILFGIYRLPDGKKRRELAARSAQYFAVVPCAAVPVAAPDEYARLKVETQRQGKTIGDNDLWIAASALVLGATLVTRDPDFGFVPGLTVKDWSV
jgi:tRNA(fMet)-specific endonuclease VapC